MYRIQRCENCTTESKCYHRNFSAQVWSLLLQWSEIHTNAVDQPICEPCYQDLREVLIDRADEMEKALTTGALSHGVSQVGKSQIAPKTRKVAV